jgi:hypothetical protein
MEKAKYNVIDEIFLGILSIMGQCIQDYQISGMKTNVV